MIADKYGALFAGTSLGHFWDNRPRDPDPVIDALLQEQVFWNLRMESCRRLAADAREARHAPETRKANRLYRQAIDLANVAGLMVAAATEARDLDARQ